MRPTDAPICAPLIVKSPATIVDQRTGCCTGRGRISGLRAVGADGQTSILDAAGAGGAILVRGDGDRFIGVERDRAGIGGLQAAPRPVASCSHSRQSTGDDVAAIGSDQFDPAFVRPGINRCHASLLRRSIDCRNHRGAGRGSIGRCTHSNSDTIDDDRCQ